MPLVLPFVFLLHLFRPRRSGGTPQAPMQTGEGVKMTLNHRPSLEAGLVKGRGNH